MFGQSAFFRRRRSQQRASFGLGGVAAVIAALSAAGLVTEPVHAARQPAQERVILSDLDLSDPADVAVLQRRVSSAARRVCAKDNVGLMLVNLRACRQATVAAATPQVKQALAMSRLERVQLANVR